MMPTRGGHCRALGDLVIGCSKDVEHLLIRRQRPQIVGNNTLQRVGGRTDRVHRRQ